MDECLEEFSSFPNHVDAMRYALIRNAPENKDADFRWDEFVGYHDKELADKLGNFVNRTVVLLHKYYGGIVPDAVVPGVIRAELTKRFSSIDGLLAGFNFKDALAEAISLVDFANADLQERAPWKLYKTDPKDAAIDEAMAVAAEAVALISTVFAPFVPETAERIVKLLRVAPLSFAEAQSRLSEGRRLLPGGRVVGEPEILFAKIQDRRDQSRLALVDAQKAKLEAIREADGAPEYAPLADEIQFDDFTKLDIRTGRILSARAVKKADKLLQIEVDLGFERRTVVSGIAKHFSPEEIVGREVLVLANLAPRKLRGVQSKGMILMADTPDGGLAFVAPPKGAAPGMRVS